MDDSKTRSDRHILILDDDDLFLELANVFLKAHGCKISSFSDYDTALQFVKMEKVDAVICDVNLRSGHSGLQFHAEVQKIRGYERVLFAFATGDAIKITALQDQVSKGNVKIFLKPFSFGEIVKYVTSHSPEHTQPHQASA